MIQKFLTSNGISLEDIPYALGIWEEGEFYPSLDGETPCQRRVSAILPVEEVERISSETAAKAADTWDNPIRKIKISSGYWSEGEGDLMRGKKPTWEEAEYRIEDNSKVRELPREEYISSRIQSRLRDAAWMAGEMVVDPEWFSRVLQEISPEKIAAKGAAYEAQVAEAEAETKTAKKEAAASLKTEEKVLQEFKDFCIALAKKPKKRGFDTTPLLEEKVKSLGLHPRYGWQAIAKKLKAL